MNAPPASYLRDAYAAVDARQALNADVTALLGVQASSKPLLSLLGINTVSDLALSSLFRGARVIVEAATDPTSPFAALHRAPRDLITDAASLADFSTLADAGLDVLRALSAPDPVDTAALLAVRVSSELGVATVRELSNWPPYGAALAILDEAGLGIALISGVPSQRYDRNPDDQGVPTDLLPGAIDYPTEQVSYQQLVIDTIANAGAAAKDISTAGALDLTALTGTAAYGTLAEGALLTISQMWFPQGLTLGHLLHAVALAPGEMTQIAMIDWSRRTSGSRSDNTSESEALSNLTSEARSINEITNAVARESQSGKTTSSVSSQADNSSAAGGFSLGPLGIGGSISQGDTSAGGWVATSSNGVRNLSASMTQRITGSTQQFAHATRDRRAMVIQETSEAESGSAVTRVVANYNHMHALTVQYYEVIQMYRVQTAVTRVDKCLFVPLALIDFTKATLTTTQQLILANAALDPRAAEYLMSYATATQTAGSLAVRFDALAPLASRIPLANLAGQAAGLAAVLGASVRLLDPYTAVLPTNAVLAGLSIDLAGQGLDMPILSVTATATDGTVKSLGNLLPGQPLAINDPLTTLVAVDLQVTPAQTGSDNGSGQQQKHGNAGQVTVRLDFAASVGGATASIFIPDAVGDMAGGTLRLLSKAAGLPGDTDTWLRSHLQNNSLHYNQALWNALDAATTAALLADYTYQGAPLLPMIDPRPIAVSGNYAVYRVSVAPDATSVPAGGQPTTGQAWHSWLVDHGCADDALAAAASEQLLAVPTGGVFAEAVLGRSNSAELLDLTRFWHWQDSPVPLQPTEIQAPSLASRAQPADLSAAPLPAPMVNIVSPMSMPDPTALAATLSAISNGNMFRDMSGATALLGAMSSLASDSMQGAQTAGGLANDNLAQAYSMQKFSEQLAAQMVAGAMGWPMPSGGSDTAPSKTVSGTGAALNYARQRDAAVGTGASSGGAAGGNSTSSGHSGSGSSAQPGTNGGGTTPAGGIVPLQNGSSTLGPLEKASWQSLVAGTAPDGTPVATAGVLADTQEAWTTMREFADHAAHWLLANASPGITQPTVDAAYRLDSDHAEIPLAQFTSDAIKFQYHRMTFSSPDGDDAMKRLLSRGTFTQNVSSGAITAVPLTSDGSQAPLDQPFAVGDLIRWQVKLTRQELDAITSAFNLSKLDAWMLSSIPIQRQFLVRVLEVTGPNATGALGGLTVGTVYGHPYAGRRTWQLNKQAAGYELMTAEVNTFPWVFDLVTEVLTDGSGALACWNNWQQAAIATAHAQNVTIDPAMTYRRTGKDGTRSQNVLSLTTDATYGPPTGQVRAQLPRLGEVFDALMTSDSTSISL